MSQFMKLSSYYLMFFIFYFTCLSVDTLAEKTNHFIKVPLPVFKKQLEKTRLAAQSVASTLSHMHAGVDDRNSTNRIIVVCEEMLNSAAGVSGWVLSTFPHLKDNVFSEMKSWLSLSSPRMCAYQFEHGIDSNVAKSVYRVTKLMDDLLDMIQ
ncbi:hypothetical protein ACFX13_001127 [Malus domestica]